MADRAVFVSAGRTVRSQSVAEAGEQDRRYAVAAIDGPALESALRKLGARSRSPAASGASRPSGQGLD